MKTMTYFLAITLISLTYAATTPPLPPVPMPGTTPISLSTSSSSAAIECKNTDAQKAKADSLYARGMWKDATIAYEALCPCVARKTRTLCLLQAIRSLAQDSSQITNAVSRLDSLTLTTEPEDSGFGELMLTQAMLYVQVGEPARALKSWKLARQVVLPGQDANLKALCVQIRQLWKDTTISTDCNKIPVLAKHLAAALPTPVLKSSSAILSSSSSSVSTEPLQPAIIPSPTPEGNWTLQFGAFSTKENAELLLQNLKSRKIPSRLVTKNTSTKVLWLVQTEPFRDKAAAELYGKTTLTPLGLDYQPLPVP